MNEMTEEHKAQRDQEIRRSFREEGIPETPEALAEAQAVYDEGWAAANRDLDAEEARDRALARKSTRCRGRG
jgi:hypothetical protein